MVAYADGGLTGCDDADWWKHDEGDAHGDVLSVIRRLREQQTSREEWLKHCWQLFGGRPVAGFTAEAFTSDNAGYDRLPTNVVKRVCTALQSELVQNRPRPMFLTDGGDYGLQQQVQQLTKFCEGVFAECEVDRAIGPKLGMMSCIFGTSIAKVLSEANKPRIEIAMPWEVLVDEQDGLYGAPRCMYQARPIDRYRAAALYPDHRDEIMSCKPPDGAWAASHAYVADQILLVEAWHLESAADEGDGRHVLAIDGATLVDEEWTDPDFPFAFFHFEEPILGFWGIGVADILTGRQIAINKLERNIQEAFELSATLRVFIPNGSGIPEGHIGNSARAVIRYNAAAGEVLFRTDPAVHPQHLQERSSQIAAAFEDVGLSQMTAQSEKPAGLDSGRALRIFIDNQSRRFLKWLHDYESVHLDLAKKVIRVMKKLASDHPDESIDVVYRAKGHIERIKWSEVDLDEDSYIVECFPMSLLPNTPAGRLATVQDMVNSGFAGQLGLAPEQLLDMLDLPDLESAGRLIKAPLEAVQSDLESILRDGEYLPPEPFHNLKLCVLIGGQVYLDSRRKKVPEQKLEMLRQYIADAKELLAQAAGGAAQGAPPSPQMAPASGPGAGAPPPPMPMAAAA